MTPGKLKFLKLAAFFIMLMPLSVLFLIKAMLNQEPQKSAFLISELQMPDAVTYILLPDPAALNTVNALRLAAEKYRVKQYEAAEKILKDADSKDPQFASLTGWPMAKTLAVQNKQMEAISHLERISNGNQLALARNLHTVGFTLTTEDHWTEAAPLFERASAIFLKEQGKDSADAAKDMANLGSCLIKKGENEAGKRSYEAALKILERNPQANPQLLQTIKMQLEK